MVFGNTVKKMILGVAGLVFGTMVAIAPVKGWFQIGLAALLSGIGWLRIIYADALLAKMIPPKQ